MNILHIATSIYVTISNTASIFLREGKGGKSRSPNITAWSYISFGFGLISLKILSLRTNVTGKI